MNFFLAPYCLSDTFQSLLHSRKCFVCRSPAFLSRLRDFYSRSPVSGYNLTECLTFLFLPLVDPKPTVCTQLRSPPPGNLPWLPSIFEWEAHSMGFKKTDFDIRHLLWSFTDMWPWASYKASLIPQSPQLQSRHDNDPCPLGPQESQCRQSRVLAPRHVLLVEGGSLIGSLPLPPNPSSHHETPEERGPSRGSGLESAWETSLWMRALMNGHLYWLM